MRLSFCADATLREAENRAGKMERSGGIKGEERKARQRAIKKDIACTLRGKRVKKVKKAEKNGKDNSFELTKERKMYYNNSKNEEQLI